MKYFINTVDRDTGGFTSLTGMALTHSEEVHFTMEGAKLASCRSEEDLHNYVRNTLKELGKEKGGDHMKKKRSLRQQATDNESWVNLDKQHFEDKLKWVIGQFNSYNFASATSLVTQLKRAKLKLDNLNTQNNDLNLEIDFLKKERDQLKLELQEAEKERDSYRIKQLKKEPEPEPVEQVPNDDMVDALTYVMNNTKWRTETVSGYPHLYNTICEEVIIEVAEPDYSKVAEHFKEQGYKVSIVDHRHYTKFDGNGMKVKLFRKGS